MKTRVSLKYFVNDCRWLDRYTFKERKKLHPLKREAGLKMLVTNGQYTEKSKNCIFTKKLFKELKDNPSKLISQKVFVEFRIDFQSAHGDDKILRIEVADYKTVDIYNSGKGMLYSFEYKWLMLYVMCVRSKLSTINTNYIFASWNENKMASGDISSLIHNLWRKAGNFVHTVIRKKLSNNIIRKSSSTLVREVDITKKQVVADSMLHSDKIADIHYAT